ncbi:hypothetical protein SAY87_031244 [Trapa incisa]|uniref:Uncharacterized protein n=1 Tax=Trapa incisa TaxID=236973 RepID=A0AAN7KPF9_9MYRT|nr:hypothetical protein SAY87_031244 [Trapa incisa]
MSSLFNVFDGVCEEFLGRKGKPNVGPTVISTSSTSLPSTQGAMVSDDSIRKKEEVEKERTLRRGLRFAPELDGLNCFETVVFHSSAEKKV